MAKFQIIGDEATPEVAPPVMTAAQSKEREDALKILMTSLAVVNKRFVTALSNLFTAGALFSVWMLWRAVLPSPSINQLVGISLYCVFILSLEWLRRR